MAKRRKLKCFKCGCQNDIVRRGQRRNGSRWALCQRCLGDWYSQLMLGNARLDNAWAERVGREER